MDPITGGSSSSWLSWWLRLYDWRLRRRCVSRRSEGTRARERNRAGSRTTTEGKVIRGVQDLGRLRLAQPAYLCRSWRTFRGVPGT